jgi:hypothetical protein
MTTPSSRDLEQLSAYLDGQLSRPDRKRLQTRIHSDPALASALGELSQTRALLRRTPQRRAPRNFTLTSGMAGIRPPVPRLVPVLSWASAVAMLFFIFTLGASLVGQLSLGAAPGVSMNAVAPSASGAAPQAAAATVAPATMAPVMAAPATTAPATAAPVIAVPTEVPATMPPVMAVPATTAPATLAPDIINSVANAPAATKSAVTIATAPPAPGSTAPSVGSANPPAVATPTEEISIMAVEQATPPAIARVVQPPSTPKAFHKPVNIWLFLWPGLALLLGVLAIVTWGLNKRAFRRKNTRG